MIIPRAWIGFLGVVPIVIGIKRLIDWWRRKTEEVERVPAASVFTVAAITFANGGDNIAIYIPLFANSDHAGLVLTLLTFAVMIAIWCVVGYYVGNHRAVRQVIDRYGHALVPLVLIGLGIYIIVNAR